MPEPQGDEGDVDARLKHLHRRWLSLKYKAWEKQRLPMACERSQLEKRFVDRLHYYLFDLVGLGTRGLCSRMLVRDETFLLYAGVVARRPRSASALRGVLRDYFGVPVEIVQCIGGRCELEPEDRSYMRSQTISYHLGVAAIAGDAVWGQQSRFRIKIGPVSYRKFCSFLPGTRAVAELEHLVRFFVGAALAFDIQLVLEREEVPSCRLHEAAPRLGWDSWLAEGGWPCDAEDAIFNEAA